MMKALCFAIFACAFNLLLGFTGLLSFGHAAFFGAAAYATGWLVRSAGWPPELGVLAGIAVAALLGLRGRADRDPPPGHLLRDDHAGDGADGLLRLPAGAVHRRRGRPAGRAARQAVRAARRWPNDLTHVLRRAGGLRGGVPVHHPHRALAVRPGAEGDPRERAARDLAGLRRRPLQAARLRAVDRAGRPGRVAEDAGARLRHAVRRALVAVRRGRADDAARRHGHLRRPGARRVHDHRPAELPGRPRRLVGHGDHRRDLRRLRARVPHAASSASCWRGGSGAAHADGARARFARQSGLATRVAGMTARTLYDKLWDEHVVHTEDDGTAVLYIDRHLVHEVTSPQAFEGLRLAGRKPWRVSSIVATADHNTPTTDWERGYDGIADPISQQQVDTLDANITRVRRRRPTSRSSTSARASCT